MTTASPQPVLGDDRAPRWLVRWLVTGLLLAALVGIGLYINWELGAPDRMDAALHRLNCAAARQVVLYESEPGKAMLMAASARLVCAE